MEFGVFTQPPLWNPLHRLGRKVLCGNLLNMRRYADDCASGEELPVEDSTWFWDNSWETWEGCAKTERFPDYCVEVGQFGEARRMEPYVGVDVWVFEFGTEELEGVRVADEEE
jgi:hypothetical protein